MDDILHRTRLLLGDAAIAKIQNSCVMVVGCGAVGSFAIESLARAGVGRIIVVDFDIIQPSNVNRQLFATHSTIGAAKVDVATARIHDINPNIDVVAVNTFWDDDSDIDITPDIVIDAIDSVDSKIALYKWCNKNDIPFIASMGAARKLNPRKIQFTTLYQTNTCPLAARVRKLCRDAGIPDFPVVFSGEVATPTGNNAREFGSIITVTGMFGLYLTHWVIMQIIDD